MSLQSNLSSFITRVGTEFKTIRTLVFGSATGGLSGLATTDKASIVAAINEARTTGGAGSPPSASETVAGVLELATLAEVTTGTDTSRAVTPAGVRQEINTVTIPDATETVKGKVELATLVEVSTGTDTTRAVTAAGVRQEINSVTIPDATESVKGKVELATLAEMTTGTDTVRAVTPAGVRQEVNTAKVDASVTVKGIVELATLAEVTTGTDSVRAVTPQALKQETDAVKAAILNSAPAALDTLDELAAALGDDANFASTVTNALANKQPLDTDLTAIAALTSAANQVPYATGAGTWALSSFTAAGRALVDDADVAAQRTTLSVYSQAEMGNPETDLVALFDTAIA